MENVEMMSADPQTDWGLVLPREALHAVMRGLHRSLPSSHTDTPEDWARRDRAAMAAVGALRPADAMEGELAAQIVSARAWAKDCLQLAVERQEDFGAAVKCKAQALSMMREVKSAWNLLLKVQAARRAVEQDETASTQAEWIEYAVIKTMAEVLPELARPEAAPEAAPVCEPQELIEVATEITAEEASELEQISYAAKNSTDACRETEPRSRTAPAREAEFA